MKKMVLTVAALFFAAAVYAESDAFALQEANVDSPPPAQRIAFGIAILLLFGLAVAVAFFRARYINKIALQNE